MVGGSRSWLKGPLLPTIRRTGGLFSILKLERDENSTIGEKPEHRPCHGGANNWTGPHCQGGKGKNSTTRKGNIFLICNRDVEAERWEIFSASLLPSSIPMSPCRWSSPIISAQGLTGESKEIIRLNDSETLT